MKLNLTKVLVMGLLAAVAVSLFSCQKKEQSETISFWMQQYGGNPQGQQDYINGVAAKFKEETGITVNVTYVDWSQANTKYTLAATGGEFPDVADTFFPYTWVKIGGEKNGLLEIPDVVQDVGLDKFFPVAVPEIYIDGKYYGLPWRGDTRAAAYNQQIFDENGITEFPKTYDELIEVGKKLTTYNADGTVDRAGFLFFEDNARFDQTFFAILAGFGGAVMKEPDFKEWTFNSPQGAEALQFMQDAVYKHKIVPEGVIDPSFNSQQVFFAGKAAIILGSTAEVMNNCKVNAPQLAPYLKSALMPTKTGSGRGSVASAAPVVIFKNTKHPEAAKKWLKYFTSKDVQIGAMKAMSLMNVWYEVANDPYFSSDPWFANFTEQTNYVNPMDMPIPEFGSVDAFPSGPLNNMCTKVMNNLPVQAALDEASEEVRKIMAQ